MSPPLARLLGTIDSWPRPVRLVVKIGLDAGLVAMAFAMATLLRFGGVIPPGQGRNLLFLLKRIKRS